MKLASCKSALNTPMVYSTDRSKAVVRVLVLLFVALWFILRGNLLCLTMCNFVLVFFSPFSIVITSLGEERANLSAFRTFVRFVLVWICRFPLPLGVWEGLRFVIVALPGLFSYLFLGKYQWIFTKPSVWIDIVEIWFGIVNGRILSMAFHKTWCIHWYRGDLLLDCR